MLGLHAHLNLTFAHLTALHNRFGLIEPKETEVLHDLEIALHLYDDTSQEGGGVSSTQDASENKDSGKPHSSDEPSGMSMSNGAQ